MGLRFQTRQALYPSLFWSLGEPGRPPYHLGKGSPGRGHSKCRGCEARQAWYCGGSLGGWGGASERRSVALEGVEAATGPLCGMWAAPWSLDSSPSVLRWGRDRAFPGMLGTACLLPPLSLGRGQLSCRVRSLGCGEAPGNALGPPGNWALRRPGGREGPSCLGLQPHRPPSRADGPGPALPPAPARSALPASLPSPPDVGPPAHLVFLSAASSTRPCPP